MDARLINRIETNVDRGASALFAAAVGFAVQMILRAWIDLSEVAACAVAATAIAYLVASRSLSALANRRRPPPIRIFDLRAFDAADNGELLLTERVREELVLTNADRLRDELVLTAADRINDELQLTEADRVGTATAGEPLVLDDILAELGPEARVVRLFDRKAMPTPGQLKSRIDSHLGQVPPSAGASDASQALSDALAELRRSLR
jgi:hypothetical protein